MDLSFLARFGFAKANAAGVYEIPFLDRMGFVFIICVIGMVLISLFGKQEAKGLEIDKRMFKMSPGFAVGALIICGILAALYTIYY